MNEFSGTPRQASDEPHDARALARALALVGRRLEAAERHALKDHGLAPATFGLLDLLAREGPMAPSEAAARLEVRQPTVTAWLNALRAADLLERDAVAGDGRRVRLTVSARGRELHGDAADLVRRRQGRVLAVVDPVAQADLLATLRRISAGPEVGEAEAASGSG